jgi:hypothetical protein
VKREKELHETSEGVDVRSKDREIERRRFTLKGMQEVLLQSESVMQVQSE